MRRSRPLTFAVGVGATTACTAPTFALQSFPNSKDRLAGIFEAGVEALADEDYDAEAEQQDTNQDHGGKSGDHGESRDTGSSGIPRTVFQTGSLESEDPGYLRRVYLQFCCRRSCPVSLGSVASSSPSVTVDNSGLVDLGLTQGRNSSNADSF